MTDPATTPHESYPDTHHDTYSKTVFGFWTYLVTDFILFATLFATYLVLHRNTFGGPPIGELVHLPFALTQTLILLVSSFTSGLAGAFAHRKNKNGTILLFAITFLLGIAFMWMELTEFHRFLEGGNSWTNNASLSTFFTLVGTYGAHMFLALLWTVALIIPICRQGITTVSLRRLTCLRMFWQFLNIIWVFIFTIVYLMGGN
ncbi:MAG: Cytochrome bo(3) ubiquinol oxidase subunit 3 [Chlamydiae bacterium]|nr:Cytochrome bo(3) ubiquinol oxidase subunit 3 [Chlamydiota bacterium]